MNREEKFSLLRDYLEQIAPDEEITQLEEESSGLEAMGGEDQELDSANTGLEKIGHGNIPEEDEFDALEAIILPKHRPVINIISGTFETPPSPWTHLGGGEAKNNIEAVIPSIGRVEVPEHPSAPYGGTGFVVGDGLIMTNRHVAELFSVGVGLEALEFRPGQTAALDFKREVIPTDPIMVNVESVFMIHPHWDMALLKVSGLPEGHPILKLSTGHPDDLVGRDVAIVGYPAQDWRNDLDLQNRIFGGIYNVKRMQPGKLRKRDTVGSFGHKVTAVTHDSSTLGGNSGSGVVDAQSGEIVGLHFAGRYLKANYAVPMYELARDKRVVDAGVNFTGSVAATDEWLAAWTLADGGTEAAADGAETGTSAALPPTTLPAPTSETQPQRITWTIPLRVTVELGEISGGTLGEEMKGAPEAEIEAVTMKIDPDDDYGNRPGYDPRFLGDDFEIPLPELTDEQLANTARNRLASADSHVFPYHHFSLVMNKERRLAYYTAGNVDGRREKSISRNDFSDRWFLDPRLEKSDQLQNDLYYDNDLDRGHLVRRLDPVWGDTFAEAKLAHDDSFHWTNGCPQHKDLNRNNTTWGLVEDFVLRNAQAADQRISVFTGPVFRDDDPIYETRSKKQKIPLPRSFWKIVASIDHDGILKATAFLLDQESLIAPLVEAIAIPKQFQKSVKEIENLTGFSFHQLRDFDTLTGGGEEGIEAPSKELSSLSDIVW